MNNFKGLYDLANVANMYNVEEADLMQKIGETFINNIDVKKFGETWLIAEEALLREFGYVPLFDDSNYHIK